MVKIVKNIVNDQKILIGFVMEGKDKDFGGMTDMEVQRTVPLSSLSQGKFQNRQVKIERNSIIEQGTFKLNQLPMAVVVGNGLIDVDSGMTLVKRYVQNNENVGFDVRFGDGSVQRIPYKSLLMYSRWFKPVNFVVRTKADNKTFISGKAGETIDSLPTEYIGAAPTRKKLKSGARDKEKINKASTVQVGTGIDILDIYRWIISNGGAYINLAGTKYVARTMEHDEKAAEESAFVPLEVSELCTSPLQFNPVNLNVNAPFKKAGIVRAPFNGQQIPIVTYIDRTKSLFVGGKDYVHKFGVAVPESKESEMINTFGKSLAFTKINDESITKPLRQIIDSAGLVFYFVEATNIDLLSKTKVDRYSYSTGTLMDLVLQLNDCKVISKCFSNKGKFMKTLKQSIGEEASEELRGRKLFGIFASMNDETLEVMKEMGFNVYTGGFSLNDYSKSKKSGGSAAEEPISIDYLVDGRTITSETGDKLIQLAMNKEYVKMSHEVGQVITSVTSLASEREIYKRALEVAKEYADKQSILERRLWCHNVAMLMLGNNKVIHTRDFAKWEYDDKASSRLKSGQIFACTDGSADGLKVKFTGVQFAK